MEPLLSYGRGSENNDSETTKFKCQFCEFTTAHKFSLHRHEKKMHQWFLIMINILFVQSIRNIENVDFFLFHTTPKMQTRSIRSSSSLF